MASLRSIAENTEIYARHFYVVVTTQDLVDWPISYLLIAAIGGLIAIWIAIGAAFWICVWSFELSVAFLRLTQRAYWLFRYFIWKTTGLWPNRTNRE